MTILEFSAAITAVAMIVISSKQIGAFLDDIHDWITHRTLDSRITRLEGFHKNDN